MALSIDEKIRLIKDNRSKLENTITESYKGVIESRGSIEYQIYIWSDGEIETLVTTPGSNDFLQAKDWEERELIHVCTVAEPCFDPWMYTDDGRPEDDAEAEAKEKEIVEWVISDYDPGEEIDQCIELLKRDKMLEEYDI